MINRTLTRLDLANSVFKQTGLPQNESAKLVGEIIQHITNILASGEDVKISSFGVFNIRQKNARLGRNPKTGEKTIITPRHTITFRPSRNMKLKIIQRNKKFNS